MSVLAQVRTLAGAWEGTSRLFLPGDPTREVPSQVIVSLLAQEKFCTIAYTWSFDDTPQDGLLLVGQEQSVVRVVFVDSWHIGDAFMLCQGQADEDSVLDVRCAYAVEGSADWGWRIVVAPTDTGFRVEMYNVTPDGEEMLGVEASYTQSL